MRIPKLSLDPRDAVGLIGLVAITAGLVMIYIPAALIVPGAVLLGLAVWRLR